MKARTMIRNAAFALLVLGWLGLPGPCLGQGIPLGAGAGDSPGLGIAPPRAPSAASVRLATADSRPVWPLVFGEDGRFLDRVGAAGDDGPNGVPDAVDLYRACDGFFVFDNVDPTSAIELSALIPGDEPIANASIGAEQDIANAYGLLLRDEDGNAVLFAAVERVATAGTATIEVELNQDRVRLGWGRPWQLLGERTPGDLLLRLSLADGALTSAEVSRWEADRGFTSVTAIATEGCASDARDLCVASNQDAVVGGPWTGYDVTYPERSLPPVKLEPHAWLELQLNLGRLVEPGREFGSVFVRTAEDAVLGYLGEKPWSKESCSHE